MPSTTSYFSSSTPLLLPVFPLNSKKVGTQVFFCFSNTKYFYLRVFALILLGQEHSFPQITAWFALSFLLCLCLYKTANTQPTSSHTLSCFISPELFSPSGVQYIYLLSTPSHWNLKSTWKWILSVSRFNLSIPASTTVPGTQVVFNKYFN